MSREGFSPDSREYQNHLQKKRSDALMFARMLSVLKAKEEPPVEKEEEKKEDEE